VQLLLSSLGGAALGAFAVFALMRRAIARARRESIAATEAAKSERAQLRARQTQELQQVEATLRAEADAARAQLAAAREQQRQETDAREAAEHAEQTAVEPEPSEMARAFSRDLATIVSGIEGGTFRLIESTPSLRAQGDAVESLWLAIRRLRRFHGKVAAYSHAPHPTPGSVQIDRLLTSLREELSSSALGLQISWNLPQPSLRLCGDHDDLLLALTLATTALHHLERGAMRLLVQVEPSFEGAQPEAHVQLVLERDESLDTPSRPHSPSASFLVARTAAAHLLRAYGATMTFAHEPGHEASAVVQIPLQTGDEETEFAAEQDARAHQAEHADASAAEANSAQDEPIVTIPRAHRYGGVLVLEEDASVRNMLATELKAQGRAVFACPDGAAARSLIQATPERFEVLVVDHVGRLDAGDMLASTVTKLCPELRVFVLSEVRPGRVPSQLADRVTEIRKPFGVRELRRALAAALTV